MIRAFDIHHLCNWRPVRQRRIRTEQHDIALLRNSAEHQHLGFKTGDSPHGEIDHGYDLAANQLPGFIPPRKLCRGLLDAERAKSIFSLIAGFRASGKGSASRIVPIRISSFKKNLQSLP